MKYKLSFFVALCLSLVKSIGASPPAGVYELYNEKGQRTGTVTSSLTKKGETSELKVITDIRIVGVTSDHRFTETETVTLDKNGVLRFRRESNEEGKVSFTEGERNDKALIVRTERNGTKLTTAFPLSSFDLTEFEMDLAASPFRQLKTGQSKALRVLYLDRMQVIQLSRNATVAADFPTAKGPVQILRSAIDNKLTASYFDTKTGDLLQEEGPDYLMTRVKP